MSSTLVHIDSRDRERWDLTTPTEYVFPLPQPLKQVVGARIVSVEMPSSFYVFRQAYGNTSVSVTVGGVTTKTVTIPDGNYNAVSINQALQNALDAAFSPSTFTCSVSQTTLQMSIQESTNQTVAIDTTIAADEFEFSTTLAYFLGFRYNVPASGDPLVSPGVVSLNPFTYSLLDIRELQGGASTQEGGIFGARMSPTSAFAKIPINNNSFEYTFWEPTTSCVIRCNPAIPRLDRLTIQWRFHDMTPIDFNDLEHSFTIEFITKDPSLPPSSDLDSITRHVASIAKSMEKRRPPKTTTTHNTTHIIEDHSNPFPKKLLVTLAVLASITALYLYMSPGKKT